MLRLLTFGGLSLEADDGRRGLLDGQRKALALLVLLAHAGRGAEALAQVRALEEAPGEQYLLPSVVARVYIALDQPDRAFEWLERAYRERDGWLSYARTDPAFDPVRSDTRFGELLRRMKLE